MVKYSSSKTKNSDYLSEVEKSDVQNKIKSIEYVNYRPEIVDPEIVKILISSTFKYNKNDTTLSQGELESLVKTAIVNFDNTNLNNFDSIFRHSNLTNQLMIQQMQFYLI